jgi:hypothetical protein
MNDRCIIILVDDRRDDEPTLRAPEASAVGSPVVPTRDALPAAGGRT